MTLTISAAAYQQRTTEAEMEAAIRDIVARRNGRCWHVRDTRQSPEMADAPDLLILLPGAAFWIELKSQTRTVTKGQTEVAELLASVTGFIGGVVRPEPRAGELSYDALLERLREG